MYVYLVSQMMSEHKDQSYYLSPHFQHLSRQVEICLTPAFGSSIVQTANTLVLVCIRAVLLSSAD